ncbi:hypothetical protein Rs2_41539 [Raphanus sativus]|nr:hypothetical protein Rs2_41539 [Raphanus sativus]
MFRKLACASPLVCLPQVGTLVTTSHKVIANRLLFQPEDKDSNEIYAQMSLQPVHSNTLLSKISSLSFIELLDQALQEACGTEEILKCLNAGLQCVQEDHNDRPTMSNVVFMLGSSDAPTTLPNTKQPAYVLRRFPSSSKASSSKIITLVDGRK